MLIDVTLREGEQAFGVYFDLETKYEIIRRLIEIGVDEIEMGYAGQEELPELMKYAKSQSGRPSLSIWSPLRKREVELALALRPDFVNIGVPVSDVHLEKRLDITRAGLLKKLAALPVSVGARGDVRLSVGLEDVSRADPEFALTAAATARLSGVRRIRLADTVGWLAPSGISSLVGRFKAEVDIPLGVHCHNDFGLAAANAVTALEAGADYADVSVMGLGERAGIAALEEVAAHLALRKGQDYRIAGLPALCALVSKAAHNEIHRNKPIVGRDVFASESGLHVDGLKKSPDLFEPFPPEKIEAGRKTAVGKKSGRSACAFILEQLGLHLPTPALAKLVAKLRDRSRGLGRTLTEEEIFALAGSDGFGPDTPVLANRNCPSAGRLQETAIDGWA
jgi:homocitrate synthase NifV